MKRWIRYTLLGVAAYVVFLVTLFPADRGYAMIKGQLASAGLPLKLYGLEGSVWDGRATTAEFGGQRFETVTWEMHPSALLLGATEARVGLRRNEDHLQAVVGRGLGGGLYADQVQARLSMAELMTALRIPAVKLDGQLRLNLTDVRLEGNTLTEAYGTIGWYGAATQFPQGLTLGDLTAKLDTTSDGVKATLGDAGGPLELSGELLVQPDGQYKLNATLASREGPQSTLARSLRMMGRPDASGKVKIAQSGNLADFGFLFK